MSDLFGNHIVGFLTRRLISCLYLICHYIIVSLTKPSYQEINVLYINWKKVVLGTLIAIRSDYIAIKHFCFIVGESNVSIFISILFYSHKIIIVHVVVPFV